MPENSTPTEAAPDGQQDSAATDLSVSLAQNIDDAVSMSLTGEKAFDPTGERAVAPAAKPEPQTPEPQTTAEPKTKNPEPKAEEKDPVKDLADENDADDFTIPLDDLDDDPKDGDEGDDSKDGGDEDDSKDGGDEDDSKDGGDEDDPKDGDDIRHQKFKELRDELKEVRAQAKALEQEKNLSTKQVQEMEAKLAEAEELRKQVKEYESELSVSRLEATPEYRKAVVEPLTKVVDYVSQLAEAHELDENAVLDALMHTDPAEQEAQLEELVTGLPAKDAGKLFSLVDGVRQIVQRRDHLQANADKALQELEDRKERQQQEEMAQRAEERKETAQKVIDRIKRRVPSLKNIEGVDFDGLEKSVGDTDFSELNVANQVYNHTSGLLLPQVLRELNNTRQALEKALDDASDGQRADPGAGGGGRKPSGAQGSGDANLSFVDAVEKALS